MSIYTDHRGHLVAQDDDGQVLATVLDMGDTCAVDALVPELTPDQAYEYAHAIFRWAAGKRRAARATRATEPGTGATDAPSPGPTPTRTPASAQEDA